MMGNYYKRSKKKKDKVIRPFACTYDNCGEMIILLSSKNGNIPINYSSVNQADRDMLRLGYKLIFRPDIHVPHPKTCKKKKVPKIKKDGIVGEMHDRNLGSSFARG